MASFGQRTERPQGWCNARREKNGNFYQCYYGCEATFKSRVDAKRHELRCQSRAQLTEERRDMCERAGVPELSPTTTVAGNSVGPSSVGSESSAGTLDGEKEALKERNRRFRQLLRELPRVDLLSYV